MNSDITKEVELVESVYTQTQALIDGMPTDGDGKRMQIKDMAEAVAVSVGMEPKDVLHMVNRYAHNTSSGYVTRGKKGGFIKGTRPLKAAPVPSQAVDSSTSIVDVDDAADTDLV
jgi:hypothetical protein